LESKLVFELEFSPSDRAKCKICTELIYSNEVRLKANLGSGYYPGYYHVSCFIKIFDFTLNLLSRIKAKQEMRKRNEMQKM